MNKLETLIIVIVLGVIFARLVIYWLTEYGKKQVAKAHKFEFHYEIVKGLIDSGGDSEEIKTRIAFLRDLKYDREKVDVLEDEFNRKLLITL